MWILDKLKQIIKRMPIPNKLASRHDVLMEQYRAGKYLRIEEPKKEGRNE